MRRPRKTYARPTKRWDKSRIDEERQLVRDYGLKNKEELWKAKTVVSKFRSRARKQFTDETGKEELFARLRKLGIFRKEATLDDVLGLTVESVLERRLQTLVLRKGFASTASQARQLITHRHIMIGRRVVDIPGYIVTVSEEKELEYSPRSPLSDKDHPLHKGPRPAVKGEGKEPEGGEERTEAVKEKKQGPVKKEGTAEKKEEPKKEEVKGEKNG